MPSVRRVERNGIADRDEHTLTIDTSQLDSFETPYELVSKMRASISVLGPLIGRFGRAFVAMPGGCQIGARKIDMHLRGLEALGVEFTVEHGNLRAETPNGLHGAHVVLDFPSVGATENLLMASVVAEGETVIANAAREPEIVDLANMLNEMGAQMSRRGRRPSSPSMALRSTICILASTPRCRTASRRARSSWAAR